MTSTLPPPVKASKPSAFVPLNAKKPVPSTGGPGGDPPAEPSGGNTPNPHLFDAYWIGFYVGPLGNEQIDLCNAVGWVDEFAVWIREHGFFRRDLFPHRFIIGKKDPGTLKACDLTRREFFTIQKQFDFLVGKYGFRLSGALYYSREVAGQPLESYPEYYDQSRVSSGDSIGRPGRHSLPRSPRVRKYRL